MCLSNTAAAEFACNYLFLCMNMVTRHTANQPNNTFGHELNIWRQHQVKNISKVMRASSVITSFIYAGQIYSWRLVKMSAFCLV